MTRNIRATLGPGSSIADARALLRDIEKATGLPNQSAEIITNPVTGKVIEVKANPNPNAKSSDLDKAISKTASNPSVANLARLFPIVKKENWEGFVLGNITFGSSIFEGCSSYMSPAGDHQVVNGLNGKALHHDINEVQEDEFTPRFNASSFGLANITAAKFKCLTNNANEPVFEFALGSHKLQVVYQTNIKVKNGAAVTIDTGVAAPSGNSTVEILLLPNIQQVTVDGVIVFQGTDLLLSATMIQAIFTGVGKLYDEMEVTVLAGTV